MQQAVLAGQQRDERTEGRRLDDGAEEALPDLGHLRVGDRVDRVARSVRRRAVDRTDEDGAVVLDADVGAGVVLDLVDHLALRADDLTDLVDRDLDRDDPRRGRRHLVRGVDGLVHHVEDVQARVASLRQRAGQDRGGDAVELGVELDRGDELLGAGDLEVHVAEGVLRTEDVGEGRVAGLTVNLVGDQTHRDARDGGAQRHTGVEQREGRGADRAHRRRAVGPERLGDLTDRVRELLAGREHRHERTLGERAVADLATLRRADSAGLTGRVRREVVVVHVALLGDRAQRVDLLLHLEHVERGDTHDLGLAALEDRGAVHARQDLDLGAEGADVGEATAVDADLVAQDALADELLLHRSEGSGELLLAAGEGSVLTGELLDEARLDVVEGALALGLAGDGEGLGGLLGDLGLDGGVGVVLVVEEARELLDRLGSLGGQLGLGLAEHLDELLRGLETLGDDLLRGGGLALVLHEVPGGLGGLGLDHHDGDVVTDDPAGDDHVEGRALDVGEVREGDPLAVDERDADAADRAGEGQTRDLRGERRGVDRQDVVLVVGVDRQDRDDDLDLVAQTLDEGRAQRPVDEPAGEDRVGAGTALPTEEAAGDTTRGVHALLDVHRQREEVEVVLGVLAGRRGRQEHGLAVEVRGDCATGLLGQAARLEPDGAGAVGTVVDNGLGELDLRTLHGSSFSLIRNRSIVVVPGCSSLQLFSEGV